MSLIYIFAFMACTFVLGFALAWAIWRYDGISKAAFDAVKKEVDFWKGSLENNRSELWSEQQKLEALREEADKLKKRLSAAAKA